MRALRIDRGFSAAKSEARAHKAAKLPADAKPVRAVFEIARVDLIGPEVFDRLKAHARELSRESARLEEELKRLTGSGHATRQPIESQASEKAERRARHGVIEHDAASF